jgi:predicted dehydrogenase
MKKKEVRFGVIGVGGRGKLAGLAHNPDDNTRIVAGADVSEKSLKLFKETHGESVFCTNDYRQLLDAKDIDAVFVTTPDFLHEEHAVAAMEAGKDVYLEKPMAITVDGCDRILRTAQKFKRKLYLGHNMRHMPFVLKMKNMIDSGAIGEVKSAWCRHFVCYGGDAYFKDWHSEKKYSTGLLLQKGAHDIDILHWLCSSYTKKVVALGNLSVYNKVADRRSPNEIGDPTFGSTYPPMTQTQLSPIIDIEDLNMMLMELENGVLCSYQQCHYTPDGWRNYTVIGTEGRVENFGDDPGDVRIFNTRGGYSEYGNERFVMPPAAEGTHGGADPAIIKEFVGFLRDECRPTTSPIAARNSVAAGFMATLSLRDGGRPLQIPELPAEVVSYFK